MIVVMIIFIIKRGRSGVPRHPLVSSAFATGFVPIGNTANNAIHQMTANNTNPVNPFIATGIQSFAVADPWFPDAIQLVSWRIRVQLRASAVPMSDLDPPNRHRSRTNRLETRLQRPCRLHPNQMHIDHRPLAQFTTQGTAEC